MTPLSSTASITRTSRPFNSGCEPKKNFVARVAALMHIPHILENEVTNDGSGDVADEVGSENKTAIESDDHIEAPALAFARDFFCQGRDARRDARRGK